MLVNGSQILAPANDHHFAVPAFNISDWAMFTGIMDISEELGAPLIVAIHPNELQHTTRAFLPSVIERVKASPIPVAIHWDHGASFEQALVAIQCGFTSVMIDKSMESFEDNVDVSRKVVEVAHAVGVSVEAELGTIGKTDDYAEAGADTIIYTDPQDAATFVKRTGVDSLAVAIGTRHGIYPPELKPELRLDLLDAIKLAAPLPLVLHGGSNNPDDEIAQSVRRGINKINISSDIKVSYHQKMREVLQDPAVREPMDVQPLCVAAMKETAAHKIRLFAADGKADLY
ncbi:ketose-bisphosphate aldolase [Cellulomonas sp. Sa3CUA2]|uniref:Ketose-bisphosphate aldolase n=1 Tax=Cellulomonas avistercoris TaxID=2762242 RepID=A0ABR8QH21_9CELL|nr:ketose-bisphosphate aldolase [Cellulomonas avistercoris]MBD7919614.1 ketose-bisphosphate aldolase [Cellulomonas avistercoris]